MRKLVKKLALVLALVLALGCIAPASAQAAEGVRRSWNFAPDEFKPTYNMTVEDEYMFEVLDKGDAVDASIYDVAYYSKSDALDMSKSTGYAVAVAAAEDVKICAVVTNKVTGNTAKVWGFVDIAAKVVETTPTATATPTATPTEAPLELVSAEQISRKSFKLVFNKDMTDVFSKSDLTVKYSYNQDSNAKYTCWVKKTSVSENEVTVELYESLKDDAYLFASYDGCQTQSFQISVGLVDRLEVATTEAFPDTLQKISIKLYDENDILLYTVNTSDDMPEEDATCEVSIVGDEGEYDDIAEADEDGIEFYELGESVLVKVVYFTGRYDENEDEIIVEGAGVIESIDNSTWIEDAVWSVTKETSSKFDKADYSSRVLCVGDTGYKVAGKLTVKIPRVDNTVDTKTKYTEKDGDKVYRYFELDDLVYESSDPTVLLVGSDGTIVPVSEGKAEIIISFADKEDDDDETVEGPLVGVCPVTVKAERKVKTVTATVKNEEVVSTNPDAADKATVEITIKDQWGAVVKPSETEYKLRQTSYKAERTPIIAKDSYVYEENTHITIGPNDKDDKLIVTIAGHVSGAAIKAAKYNFEVIVDGIKDDFDITFADIDDDDTKKYKLVASKSEVEVKVQKASELAGKITLTSWSYYDDVKNKKEIISGFYNEERVVSEGSLWVEVIVPDDVDKDEFLEKLVLTGSSITFDPYKNRPASGKWEPEAWETGKYEFILYLGESDGDCKKQSKGSVSIVLKENQESLSYSVDNITSALTYDVAMKDFGNASGTFTATYTTGSALINAIVKNGGDSNYCINVKDGSSNLTFEENGKYAIDKIVGFADGKNNVVIKEVYVKKTYDEDTTAKVLKLTISGGTVSFATED